MTLTADDYVRIAECAREIRDGTRDQFCPECSSIFADLVLDATAVEGQETMF